MRPVRPRSAWRSTARLSHRACGPLQRSYTSGANTDAASPAHRSTATGSALNEGQVGVNRDSGATRARDRFKALNQELSLAHEVQAIN